MESKDSPLLNNELNDSDIDEEINENYSKDLFILYDKIREDLSSLYSKYKGKVSENNLLNYLKTKIPPNLKLDISLFQNLIQRSERDENSNISLDDFIKKYIQAHEELKFDLDNLKKLLEKEIKLKDNLKEKICASKNEKTNKNGISENSQLSTEIGKISIISKLNKESKGYYCTISLDNSEEKKTKTKSLKDNLEFYEKFSFHIDTKEKVLIYKLYSLSNTKNPLGEVKVPLFLLNVNNEEISSQFEFKDENQKNIALFNPKIIIVTSLYDMYRKQNDNIEKNIESFIVIQHN